MLIQIKNAAFKYGDVTVFENVNLEVNEGESIGLVGANGAGKSTLLRCITGELELFSGNVYAKNGLTVGYLKQNCDLDSENTLFDEMMTVFERETRLIEQINEVSEKMSQTDCESAEYAALSDKYHRLTVEADVRDAYNSQVKVNTVLNGMGLGAFANNVVSTMSGGEKTKAALCKLLLQSPDLMILDEPTNHLDYKTLDWLENFLSFSRSTLIVVSHDRYFLDKLCTRIWDVQHKQIVCYNGNYTKYKILKAERIRNLQREYDKQQKEIAKLTDYIARNKVRASTADMAKSREKTLEKMAVAEAPKGDEKPPRFNFEEGSDPSEFPLTVRELTLGFDGKTLLEKADLQIRRGQKVALLGLNGSGKSTLIKRIVSQDPYDAGKIVFGKNVRLGYYDQENLNLQGDLRVLDQLWFDNTRMSQTEVRSLLAAVTLGAEDVYKKVSELSGGERAKLGLAMIMAKDFNFLLLDEPTNHLDLPSREALEEALRRYRGTLLFVSHDRYFVNGLADRIAELDGKKITSYDGSYDDFVNKKTEPQQKNDACKQKASSGGYRSAKQRAADTNKALRLKELEQSITNLEGEISKLNERAALPEVLSDYGKLAPVLSELEQANAELERTMAEWEKLSLE